MPVLLAALRAADEAPHALRRERLAEISPEKLETPMQTPKSPENPTIPVKTTAGDAGAAGGAAGGGRRCLSGWLRVA